MMPAWMLRLTMAFLATVPLMGQAKGPPQPRNTAMSLATDLVPFVSDTTATVVLANVLSASWVPAADEPGWEQGEIQLQVIERFSAEGPSPGDQGTIAGRRYGDPLKRRDMGFDAWNVLPFAPDHRFVLAMRIPASNAWMPLAAQFAGPNDTLAVDVKRAFELEQVRDASTIPRMYEDALRSRHDLLVRYALHAITQRARVSRHQAAEIIVRAATVPGLSPNEKLQLVQEATRRPIYDDEFGVDPTNVLVVGLLAGLLESESDPDWLLIWAQSQAALLLPAFASDPNKDREIRSTLIRSVPEPARKRAGGALKRAAASSPRDSRLSKVAEAWAAALR
jgi:hypothetical protein